jgi:CDP-6-deoxy-D-xylo-4-hexulose-3-dehydrase
MNSLNLKNSKKKIIKNINLLIQKLYENENKNNYLNKNTITLSEPHYDNKEAQALLETFLSGNLSQGKKVIEFEKNFAKVIGAKYAIATNSGSSANLISLQALKTIYNIKKNDEVILPACTFATVPMPVLQLGLKPVYVDIDLDTLNISTKEILKAITSKTKIIMPVHTLGMPCDMIEVMRIAKNNRLLVFEDCCEAHGASIKGKKVGSWGNISAFSFFVAHNITTIEGGMILTNDKNLYEHCKSLREFGRISQINLKKKDTIQIAI